MPDKSEIERIAKGLTQAQRAVVMSLPGDGEFGPASDARCARRMWWGVGRGGLDRLIEHQHRTNNSYCLNNRGLAVRASLQDQS